MTTAISRPRKPKKCKACPETFVPQRMGQKVCGWQCALTLISQDAQRENNRLIRQERKAIREAKAKAKTRGDWLKEAQQAVNRYVRLRDHDQGCISCGRPATWGGQWHASHFRSVGAASAVRFNLWNIHKACSVCNRHLSGNIAGYLPRLIEKIGAEKIAWLERQNQTIRYDIEYLKRLKTIFNRRSNRLAKMVK